MYWKLVWRMYRWPAALLAVLCTVVGLLGNWLLSVTLLAAGLGTFLGMLGPAMAMAVLIVELRSGD